MDIYADPAYAMATEQFHVIADYLNLDENLRERTLRTQTAEHCREVVKPQRHSPLGCPNDLRTGLHHERYARVALRELSGR